MKRLALIGLLVATFWPTAANAAVPCRNRIYNDWYADGKIATTYPLACYRDAIKHVSNDARIYSSLVDDIKSAMQAAVRRSRHEQVPAQVGKGKGVDTSTGKGKGGKGGTTTSTTPNSNTGSTTTTAAIGPTSGNTGGGGGGIPTPIIILGALAILLAVAGAAGTGVRYYRRRGSAPPA